MPFTEIITSLYAASSTAIVLSYLPQIRAVWRSTNGARDVSLITWIFWGIAAVIAVLYSGLIVKDKLFFFVSCGNVAGCFSIAAITYWRRKQYGRAARRPGIAVGSAPSNAY